MKTKIYTRYKNEINEKPSFLIGQKAFILNRHQRVLILLRHNKSTKADLWDFPGGRVNFEETLRQGLIREAKEETGLVLTMVSLPLSITTFIRDIDKNTQIARVIYLCKAKGKVRLSKEHSDYLWINPSEHNKYKFIDEDYYIAFNNYLKFKPKVKEFMGKGMSSESIKYLQGKGS